MRRRPALFAAASGAALAIVALILYRWYDQTPPPLVPQGPGTVPLTGSCCGVPARARGRPDATFLVEQQPGVARVVTMHEGDRQTAGGVMVRVLHIWPTPKPSHEAIDVQVTPDGRG